MDSDLRLEHEAKKLHFIEMDLIVQFPRIGNKGKYLSYNVTFIKREKGVVLSKKIVKLETIIENPEFEKQSHTVGFYKYFSGEGEALKPEYLEIRRIDNVEELWLFLNALDI